MARFASASVLLSLLLYVWFCLDIYLSVWFCFRCLLLSNWFCLLQSVIRCFRCSFLCCPCCSQSFFSVIRFLRQCIVLAVYVVRFCVISVVRCLRSSFRLSISWYLIFRPLFRLLIVSVSVVLSFPLSFVSVVRCLYCPVPPLSVASVARCLGYNMLS